MSRAVAIVALVTACGRIDFEARATDAGDLPPADAGADAPPPATRLTFGERSGADLTGVTDDSSLIDDELSLNCGGCEIIYSGPGEVGLLRFDLAGAGQATVVAARLEVFLAAIPEVNDGAVDVHAMRESWDEGSTPSEEPGFANWEFREPGVPWSGIGATGASRDATKLATFTAQSTSEPIRIELPVALVQGWIDDPAANFGVGFYGRDYTGGGGDHPHLISSEHDDPARRPLLDLELR